LVRAKIASEDPGRPKYVYAVSPKVKEQISAALSDPSVELAHLPFSRLKHLCRFEKGGFCKETRTGCIREIALKSLKPVNKTFLARFRNSHAR